MQRGGYLPFMIRPDDACSQRHQQIERSVSVEAWLMAAWRCTTSLQVGCYVVAALLVAEGAVPLHDDEWAGSSPAEFIPLAEPARS